MSVLLTAGFSFMYRKGESGKRKAENGKVKGESGKVNAEGIDNIGSKRSRVA